uniref:JNK pathway associated phosphatase n=3 Tax=Cercopithecinae TaxID=9528 RepID=A0A8I5P028_PAPAN
GGRQRNRLQRAPCVQWPRAAELRGCGAARAAGPGWAGGAGDLGPQNAHQHCRAANEDDGVKAGPSTQQGDGHHVQPSTGRWGCWVARVSVREGLYWGSAWALQGSCCWVRPLLQRHPLRVCQAHVCVCLPPRSCPACTSATSKGVKYLCIPAADSPSQNLTRHFKESIKFIHECRLRGESCLVHCLAGVSRSVTLVIAYIMTVTDFGWEDALHTVRAGRSCANPNVGFQRQLQEFEKHEVHQYRQWLREEYGESPLQDAEEAKNILGKYKEQGRVEPQPGARRWSSFPALAPLAYDNYTTET